MGRGLELVVSDGIAFAEGGDTALIVYAASARLQRIRWVFDRFEALAARAATPLNSLMVVLPSSDFPDAETRAENTMRMAGLRGRLRLVVTVVIGDSLRVSMVRTVMRAMFLLQGLSRVHHVVRSVDEGLDMLLSDPTARMPEREQLLATLSQISRQLQCSFDFPSEQERQST